MVIFIFCSCSDDLKSDKYCEVVINADGPGFLKVINNLDSRIYVFLPEYAFGAIINGNTCEIYGLATGSRKAEISKCVDYECDSYDKTKKITFVVEKGGTNIIEINNSYFN